MQPDATQQMLGYSMSLGMLVGFILEVPSGYIADRLGHKKTLIVAKRAMLITTMCYILANFFPNIIWFFLGSAFLSFGFAFYSGTNSAFLHETLTALNQDQKFGSIMSKISGKVSLIQSITFLTFPMIAQYNFMLPFYFGLIIDIFGLGIAYSLYQPQIHIDIKEHKSIFQIIKGLKNTGFYPLTIFFAFIGSFAFGFSNFREPFLLSIGYSIFFVGIVASGSRLLWWIFSLFIEKIQNTVNLKQLMIIETFFYAFYFIGVATFPNIYFVGTLLSIGLGYHYARGPIVNQYLIDSLVIIAAIRVT